MEWHWQLRERKRLLPYGSKENRFKFGNEYSDPYIFAEGIIEGTKQNAIDRARADMCSYNQIIEVWRSIES